MSYYIVYDPGQQFGEQILYIHELQGNRYNETQEMWLQQVGLGLRLWEGEFEGLQDVWLRWCSRDGDVLLTGDERAQQAKNCAEQAESRAQLLAEQLRALGIDPDTLT